MIKTIRTFLISLQFLLMFFLSHGFAYMSADPSAEIAKNGMYFSDFSEMANTVSNTEKENSGSSRSDAVSYLAPTLLLTSENPLEGLRNLFRLQAGTAVMNQISFSNKPTDRSTVEGNIDTSSMQTVDVGTVSSQISQLDSDTDMGDHLVRVWLSENKEYTTAKNLVKIKLSYEPRYPLKGEPIYVKFSLVDKASADYQITTINVDGTNHRLDEIFLIEKKAPEGVYTDRHKYMVGVKNTRNGEIKVLAGFIAFAATTYGAFGVGNEIHSETYKDVNTINGLAANKEIILANQESKAFSSQAVLNVKVKSMQNEGGISYITVTDGSGAELVCTANAKTLPSFVGIGKEITVSGKLAKDDRFGLLLQTSTIAPMGALAQNDGKDIFGGFLGGDPRAKLNEIKAMAGKGPAGSGGSNGVQIANGYAAAGERHGEEPPAAPAEKTSSEYNSYAAKSLLHFIFAVMGTLGAGFVAAYVLTPILALLGGLGIGLSAGALATGVGVLLAGLVVVGTVVGGVYLLYQTGKELLPVLLYAATHFSDVWNSAIAELMENPLPYIATMVATAFTGGVISKIYGATLRGAASYIAARYGNLLNASKYTDRVKLKVLNLADDFASLFSLSKIDRGLAYATKIKNRIAQTVNGAGKSNEAPDILATLKAAKQLPEASADFKKAVVNIYNKKEKPDVRDVETVVDHLGGYLRENEKNFLKIQTYFENKKVIPEGSTQPINYAKFRSDAERVQAKSFNQYVAYEQVYMDFTNLMQARGYPRVDAMNSMHNINQIAIGNFSMNSEIEPEGFSMSGYTKEQKEQMLKLLNNMDHYKKP